MPEHLHTYVYGVEKKLLLIRSELRHRGYSFPCQAFWVWGLLKLIIFKQSPFLTGQFFGHPIFRGACRQVLGN